MWHSLRVSLRSLTPICASLLSGSKRKASPPRNAYEFVCAACGEARTCDACVKTAACRECTPKRRCVRLRAAWALVAVCVAVCG